VRSYLIFFLPIGVSIFATAYFWFVSEIGTKWKLLALVLTGTSLALQFAPALRSQVHFLVPLLMQALVGIWFIFYRTLRG
jgi:hypothetical protein